MTFSAMLRGLSPLGLSLCLIGVAACGADADIARTDSPTAGAGGSSAGGVAGSGAGGSPAGAGGAKAGAGGTAAGAGGATAGQGGAGNGGAAGACMTIQVCENGAIVAICAPPEGHPLAFTDCGGGVCALMGESCAGGGGASGTGGMAGAAGGLGAVGEECAFTVGYGPCKLDADCAGLSPSRPICDTEARRCEVCVADPDCQDSPGGGTCFRGPNSFCGCNSAEDCPGGGVCSGHTCRPACQTNADCASDPAGPLCDPDLHHCAVCVASKDCQPGFACNKARSPAQCVPACATTADCPATSSALICSPEVGGCVECNESSECLGNPFVSPGQVFCNPATHTCVGCLASSDCQPDSAGMACQIIGPTTTGNTAGCGCLTDAECTGSHQGNRCHEGVCGCSTRADCAADQACSGSDGICEPACHSDKDCVIDPFDPTPRRHCDVASGLCAECGASSDCSGSPAGTVCRQNCDNEGRLEVPYCGCLGNEDCAGNANGPICAGQRCGCSNKSDCGPGRTCTLIQSTSGFEGPEVCVVTSCTADSDCADDLRGPSCIHGRCATCIQNDCAPDKPFACQLNESIPTCVACRNGADCPGGSCNPQTSTCD